MPNAVGDNVLSAIQRGGWSDVQVTFDRGAGAGDETETLKPALGGKFRETPVYDEGIDGKIDLKYYRRQLELDYVQTDEDTLADLFDADLDSQFHEAGVTVTLTWRNGTTTTTTMYLVRSLHNEGPQGHVGVDITMTNVGLTPLMR